MIQLTLHSQLVIGESWDDCMWRRGSFVKMDLLQTLMSRKTIVVVCVYLGDFLTWPTMACP